MTGMPWYRRFNGTWKNPKIRLVANIAQVPPSEALSVWDAILEESSESDDRGKTPNLVAEVIAVQLEIAIDHVRRIFDAFVQIGWLAADLITGWVKRQGEAVMRAGAGIAAAAKPRSRHAVNTENYRRRKAEKARQFTLNLGGKEDSNPASDAPASPLTEPLTSAENPLTSPLTGGSDREEESSTASAVEGERGALAPAPEPRAGSRKPASGGRTTHASITRRSRIPIDWQPDDRDYAFAARHGRDAAWVNRQSELFAAHHGSKGNLSTDWHQSWRTWVLRDQEFECRQSGYAGPARREPTSIVGALAELQDFYRAARQAL